jgi:hypothetical protein
MNGYTWKGAATAGALLVLMPSVLDAQQVPAPRVWEVGGVPAVNYDSDEGFGYGVIIELYRHSPGARPYVFTVQPSVQRSTRGRRDATLFFDAPGLLPPGWRLDAFVASEEHLATPYYGVGNESEYDARNDDADGRDPYFYRFGRSRRQILGNVQREIPATALRGLAGFGFSSVSIDLTPFDEGTTLLEQQLNGGEVPGGRGGYLRAGLIWDTRDREVGPRSGTWSEILVQRYDDVLGSEHEYTRWTVTDRRYISPRTERLVFANRFLLQGVHGDAPFYDLFLVQTSFKQQEGLGGAKTVRGLAKNRHMGKSIFLWNTEVRLRMAEVSFVGVPAHVGLVGFVDSGRVWEEAIVLTELVSDLHRGWGGGLRLGSGENFVVAIDVGRSGGALPIYIGLGYLY